MGLDIVRLQIRNEELFQHSVLSLDEVIKSILLLGSGYRFITYITGCDALIKQRWQSLTQKTRALGGTPRPLDSDIWARSYPWDGGQGGGGSFTWGGEGSAGGADFGTPPSGGK
jgi:hypothetical protein